ncbi:hypothetical protein Ahy_B03g067255 [Arachis hypogaea]|uniref:Reverse transcriptase zinc-binding domain-containing protein n=1 Tax=Arachis hypogaea TaxID=3818 RepID=A0A445A6D3_ARAHY|nr:hypothetical protein Ahy_B03g067255 [Arachis hypogaea]
MRESISGGSSNLWKALQKLWPQIQKGVIHRIGNGQNTKFWTDSWLHMDGCLLDYKDPNTNIDGINALVSDLVDDTGEWRYDELKNLVTEESFLQIVAMPAPRRTDPPDSIAWKHSPDG